MNGYLDTYACVDIKFLTPFLEIVNRYLFNIVKKELVLIRVVFFFILILL